MAEYPNALVYRTAMERFMAGDETAADLLDDDVVWWQIGSPPLRGKDAVLASLSGLEGLDFEIDIHDVTASEDHVVGLITATVDAGTGPFTYRTAEIVHVRDGKVTERWAFSDDTAAIIEFFGSLA